MKDTEVFSRLPAGIFRPWLEKEREGMYQYLANSSDPVAFHRAQGQVQLIERMLKLLNESK
jgi:hypothetical protein